MPSSNEGLPPPAQSLPPGDPRRHIAPIHRALTMLEHNVPILQHREPLPPYAVNFKGTAPRVRSGKNSLISTLNVPRDIVVLSLSF